MVWNLYSQLSYKSISIRQPETSAFFGSGFVSSLSFTSFRRDAAVRSSTQLWSVCLKQ